MRRFAFPLAGAAVMVLSAVGVASAAPAPQGPVDVTFTCKVSSPSGDFELSHTYGINGYAPVSAKVGRSFPIVIDQDVTTTESSFVAITDLVVRLDAPTNATVIKLSLHGGVGLGTGRPDVVQTGNQIHVRIPGPIKGGAQFKMPTVTIEATPTGVGLVESRFAGSSYVDPGMTGVVHVKAGEGTAALPKSCFTKMKDALTTTMVR